MQVIRSMLQRISSSSAVFVVAAALLILLFTWALPTSAAVVSTDTLVQQPLAAHPSSIDQKSAD